MLITSDANTQLEDTLAKMAEAAELDLTRWNRLKTAYEAISKWLSEDPDFFSEVEIEIYPQGSVSIGTTTKPYGKTEFDLDVVIHIKLLSSNYDPEIIFDEVVRRLNEHETYKKISEPKSRCVRLNYQGDFHLDVVPGCMVVVYNHELIDIPDQKNKVWLRSCPKGYQKWFIDIANRVQVTLLEKAFSAHKVEIEEYAKKKPLQRAVQLIKMRRNIYFNEKPENAPTSIILTTLAAQFYDGQASISEAFESIVSSIRNHIQTLYPHRPFELPNPVNPGENLADVWEAEPELYQHFISFIEHIYKEWEELKESHGIEEEAELMKGMFGEDPYIRAMEAKADSVNQKRENGGLGILSTGVMVDRAVEKSLPVKPNTFYGD
ncbi:MAG: nucleotidyltransferase [Imperialibacter sp.]|uniref:nucleotidyltransferase domain-containing protein n=1 Tax=Imperialibacter sp. TaxID=2038411 RepID=UPI0032EC02F4